MPKTKTLEPGAAIATAEREHLRYQKLAQDWPRLCSDRDTLLWRAQVTQDGEDRAAHLERIIEIENELKQTPYRMALSQGRSALLQNIERRAEAAHKRESADEHERRAAECERGLSGIKNKIDAAVEQVRITSLRSEAARLREEARVEDMHNLFSRMLESPRSRIEEAERQIAIATAQWNTKRGKTDDHARPLLPGPNSEQEFNTLCEAAQRNIGDARREIEAAEEAVDLDDPLTWPGQLHADMVARAQTVQRQITERLSRIAWMQ
jgi:hypothetical protein